MKTSIIAAAAMLLAAAPAFAGTDHAYVSATGGFAVSADNTSGDVIGQAGVRIAPHLLLFGDVGRFHDLSPSEVSASVTDTTATAAASGLMIDGQPRVPAWHSMAGLRFEAARSRFTPYVLGGVGVSHLMPEARFTYVGGTLPDSTPIVGDDVTAQVEALGAFTKPSSETAMMYSLGGGVEVPVARHLAVNAEYRFSRVEADAPLNAQGMTFGFGYRF